MRNLRPKNEWKLVAREFCAYLLSFLAAMVFIPLVVISCIIAGIFIFLITVGVYEIIIRILVALYG